MPKNTVKKRYFFGILSHPLSRKPSYGMPGVKEPAAYSLEPTTYHSLQQDPAFSLTGWPTGAGIGSARTLGVVDVDE